MEPKPGNRQNIVIMMKENIYKIPIHSHPILNFKSFDKAMGSKSKTEGQKTFFMKMDNVIEINITFIT